MEILELRIKDLELQVSELKEKTNYDTIYDMVMSRQADYWTAHMKRVVDDGMLQEI